MAKILVAEDSKTELNYIKKILIQKSYEVDTAPDGEMAEKMAFSKSYDLIILDIVMPKKNGFELCRVLKNSNQYKNIPILLCSVKSLEIDKIWGMKQGASAFIVKPYRKYALLASVEKYL